MSDGKSTNTSRSTFSNNTTNNNNNNKTTTKKSDLPNAKLHSLLPESSPDTLPAESVDNNNINKSLPPTSASSLGKSMSARRAYNSNPVLSESDMSPVLKSPSPSAANNSRENLHHPNSPLLGGSAGGENKDTVAGWVAHFGHDQDDFVQTASLPCTTRFSTWFSHMLNSWSPCELRRVVVYAGHKKNIVGSFDDSWFPPNVVNNRRYSIFSFWIMGVFDQFRSFLNIYFLAVALSQFVPMLAVGMLFTYIAPLAFVVCLSMAKEGYDDLKRWQQDRKINNECYLRLAQDGTYEKIKAEDIRVGTIVKIEAGKRIPADLVLLHTSESTGTCYVRTDQLDGEIDHKPRAPIKATLHMSAAEIAKVQLVIEAEAPHRDIYSFEGTYVCGSSGDKTGIDVNNTVWSGCSVAVGSVVGVCIYTGVDTRIILNAERSGVKVSLMDRELNFICFLCFLLLFLLSALLVLDQLKLMSLPFTQMLINLTRFQILCSAVLPISLSVNLQVGRMFYSILMMRDDKLEGIAVRNTNIPEELGRLHYLFSDKTGTLTKNEMHFRTLYLDDNFALEHTEVNDIKDALELFFSSQQLAALPPETPGSPAMSSSMSPSTIPAAGKRLVSAAADDQHGGGDDFAASTPANNNNNNKAGGAGRHNLVGYNKKQSLLIGRAVLALALCHQVTPVQDEEQPNVFTYQAASPDEIAMVTFASQCGVQLLSRKNFRKHDDETGDTIEGEMVLRVDLRKSKNAKKKGSTINNEYGGNDGDDDGEDAVDPFAPRAPPPAEPTILEYDVLKAFPFSSERKCMSIIVRNRATRQIQFLMKGADSRMAEVITKNDMTSWLEDRCLELAKTGRRTLVFAMRDNICVPDYVAFANALAKAGSATSNRAEAIDRAMITLERNLALLGVTGVEDLLQDNVVRTLEHLGVAGIRVFMLTGDKVETAKCIGRSTKLIRTDLVEQIVAKCEEDADVVLDQLCAVYAPALLGRAAGTDVNGTAVPSVADLTGTAEIEIRASQQAPASLYHDLGGASIMSPADQRGRPPPGQPAVAASPATEGNNGIGARFSRFVKKSVLSQSPAEEQGAEGNEGGLQVAWALVIDGATLKYCLVGDPQHPRQRKFLGLASRAESVVIARCSPTQKAQVVNAMIQFCGKSIRTAAIGDGGNDVSMIRAAHVGIGLEGVEGKQASLAADYSITKFCHCEWLITWHGRNSYLRTAQLAQFILHRGVAYGIVQAVFSVIFRGSTMSVYNSYLLTLYATALTCSPVFALVLNEDSLERDVEDYPELYRWLLKSRVFNMRSFLQWMWLAVFQGGLLMYLTIYLFADELFQITSISYTSLIITELFFVSTCVNFRILWRQRKSHLILFTLAILVSLFLYAASVIMLPDTFDRGFFLTQRLWRNVGIITAAATVPVAVLRFIESQVRKWLRSRKINTQY